MKLYIFAVSSSKGTPRILLATDFKKGRIIPFAIVILHLGEPNKSYSSTPLRTYTRRKNEIPLTTNLPRTNFPQHGKPYCRRCDGRRKHSY